jgi:hypothetical protein
MSLTLRDLRKKMELRFWSSFTARSQNHLCFVEKLNSMVSRSLDPTTVKDIDEATFVSKELAEDLLTEFGQLIEVN